MPMCLQLGAGFMGAKRVVPTRLSGWMGLMSTGLWRERIAEDLTPTSFLAEPMLVTILFQPVRR
jgi:hypothetical protein